MGWNPKRWPWRKIGKGAAKGALAASGLPGGLTAAAAAVAGKLSRQDGDQDTDATVRTVGPNRLALAKSGKVDCTSCGWAEAEPAGSVGFGIRCGTPASPLYLRVTIVPSGWACTEWGPKR